MNTLPDKPIIKIICDKTTQAIFHEKISEINIHDNYPW